MSKVFNWCFIGCGKLAGVVAEQILSSGRHNIVSVYARNFDRCSAFAAQHGAMPCRTAAEAIAAEGVDGVYIVTPHSSHYQYAKLALELGKPVLCEKALTVSARHAHELIRLAREKELYFAEAMWTWFSPVANQVKAWLDSGALGKLEKVRLNFRGEGRYYAPRVTEAAAAGGALLDIGVYTITYLYRLFGKPVSVKCRGRVEEGIDWDNEIVLRFPSGEEYVTTTSICDPVTDQTLLLQGSEASVEAPGFFYTDRAVLRRRDGSEEIFKADGSYLNEFDLVAEEIRAGLKESRYVPHQATLDVMDILDECRAQLQLVYPFEQLPETPDASRFSLMTFPLDSDLRSGSLTVQDTLQLAKEAGMAQVDLMDPAPELLPDYCAAAAHTGVKVNCFIHRMSFFCGPEEILRELETGMQTARTLGARFFMIIPYLLGTDEETARQQGRAWVREKLIAGFALAVAQGKQHGLSVCFETTPQDDLCLSATADCRYVLDHVPGLGLVLDTANMLPHGDDPLEAYELLKDKIVYVHLKDVAVYEENPMQGYQEVTPEGKYLGCVPYGAGVIPVREIYRRMLEDGYAGLFALEYARPCPESCTMDAHLQQIGKFFAHLCR